LRALDFAKDLSGRRLVREGGWVASGQVVAVAARIVGLRLITDLVSPEVFGEVVLLLGLAALGTNMFCLPLLMALVRFFPDAARGRRIGALRRLLRDLLVPRTLAVAGLLAIGGVLWTRFDAAETSAWAFVIVASLLVLDVLRLFESTLLNASRRQRAYALWYGADSVARPVLAVGTILAFGASAVSLLVGHVLAIAGTCFAFWRTRVLGETDEAGASPAWLAEMRAAMLRYAGPMMPLALLGWVISLSDRYILAGLTSPEQTGIYAAAYGLASAPFLMLSQFLSLTLRPIYFDAVVQHDRRRERRTLFAWMAALAFALLFGMTLVTAFAGPIVRVVLGEAFWGAAELVPWIAGAYGILAVQQLFEHVIQALHSTRRLLVVHSFGAAAAIGLFFALIPRHGAFGAAMAVVGSMLTSCAAAVVLSGALPRLFAPEPRDGD
jgi:O-antigen/teichoic acid export membrane protein